MYGRGGRHSSNFLKTFVVDNCGASSASEIITWGGPTATFRIDQVDDIDFKWLSIREISP